MPEIGRFLGIVIGMFHREHGLPYFHATYGDYHIAVSIETGLVTGQFPKRALRHVLEWHDLHQGELTDNWGLAQQRRALNRIASLE